MISLKFMQSLWWTPYSSRAFQGYQECTPTISLKFIFWFFFNDENTQKLVTKLSSYLDDPIIIQVGYQYLNINLKKLNKKSCFISFF